MASHTVNDTDAMEISISVAHTPSAEAQRGGCGYAPWLVVLRDGLGHVPYQLEARQGGQLVGQLPLALVNSRLFGRFLVSLPYLNLCGVRAASDEAAARLIDRAVQLGDELDVRYLELRHQAPVEHPKLTHRMSSKVQMKLTLPDSEDQLWKQVGSKVRNQINNGQKRGLAIRWGTLELLTDFYRVFSINMRDLGTPVYPRWFFRSILENLPGKAELCVVFDAETPIAGALLVHGDDGSTEVPSASSLRQYNSTNANMLMYWQLLKRAVERHQTTFDFGRSTLDSNTFRFKKQWGAQPYPTVWQYYVRRGTIGDMRPENSRYGRMIRLWQRLPVSVTRVLGPMIVRGIP